MIREEKRREEKRREEKREIAVSCCSPIVEIPHAAEIQPAGLWKTTEDSLAPQILSLSKRLAG